MLINEFFISSDFSLPAKQTNAGFTLPRLGNQALTRNSLSSSISHEENRKKLALLTNTNINFFFAPHQTHSDHIIEVDLSFAGRGAISLENALEGDACITQEKQIMLLTTFADCIPVLLYDPVTQWIASIHSGWKGTYLEIVPKTIELLFSKGVKPDNLHVALGPGISSCCYQIGDDFFNFFDKNKYQSFYEKRDNNWFFNLSGVVYQQLLACRLNVKKIEYARMCTFCHNNPHFFSYRRDRDKFEAQAAFINLL